MDIHNNLFKKKPQIFYLSGNPTIPFIMPDIAITMTMILGTMLAGIAGLMQLATPASQGDNSITYVVSPSKQAYEQFVAYYSPFWMGIFGIVVVTQIYEQFTALHYSQLCFGLALPLVLQPIVWPMGPDQSRPLLQRYSFKANVWLAIYTFIGNYWYTHYFYSVLKARYTMPAHRLNDVPIAMFGATHFYFSSYHYFSNVLLRYVVKNYLPGFWRTTLFVSVVIAFSYFTAFMETLTISSYPYWDFEGMYVCEG